MRRRDFQVSWESCQQDLGDTTGIFIPTLPWLLGLHGEGTYALLGKPDLSATSAEGNLSMWLPNPQTTDKQPGYASDPRQADQRLVTVVSKCDKWVEPEGLPGKTHLWDEELFGGGSWRWWFYGCGPGATTPASPNLIETKGRGRIRQDVWQEEGRHIIERSVSPPPLAQLPTPVPTKLFCPFSPHSWVFGRLLIQSYN